MPEPQTAPAPYEAPRLTEYGRFVVDTAGTDPGSSLDALGFTYSYV
jgi:hypothetical protein